MSDINILSAWQSALIASWEQVWNSFLFVLPNILGAIVVFSIGLILAYWVKRLVVQILNAARFEKLGNTAGVNEFFKKADIDIGLSELVGLIFEWIIILIFFLAVVDILGLPVVSSVLVRVLGYIPNIIAAVFIFAAGYMVSGLIDGVVRGSVATVDRKLAMTLGKLSRWLIVIIAAFAAIDQLQIAQGLINTFFQGLTYTIVLAVGLSVGLGAKDLIARVLNDWYEKLGR